MTGSEAWALRHAQRAGEIERSAIELLAELGERAVTVPRIAEASGISVRTFFRYFESRDAALTALPRRLNDTTCRHVAAPPAGETVLDSFVAAIAEGISAEDDDLIHAWRRAVHRGYQPAPSGNGWKLKHAEVIAARLGIDRGEERAVVLATAIAAVIRSSFFRWLELGDDDPLPNVIERSFDILARLAEHLACHKQRSAHGRW